MVWVVQGGDANSAGPHTHPWGLMDGPVRQAVIVPNGGCRGTRGALHFGVRSDGGGPSGGATAMGAWGWGVCLVAGLGTGRGAAGTWRGGHRTVTHTHTHAHAHAHAHAQPSCDAHTYTHARAEPRGGACVHTHTLAYTSVPQQRLREGNCPLRHCGALLRALVKRKDKPAANRGRAFAWLFG